MNEYLQSFFLLCTYNIVQCVNWWLLFCFKILCVTFLMILTDSVFQERTDVFILWTELSLYILYYILLLGALLIMHMWTKLDKILKFNIHVPVKCKSFSIENWWVHLLYKVVIFFNFTHWWKVIKKIILSQLPQVLHTYFNH